MKAWKCTICNYVHKGDSPPEKCPVCGADKTKFVEIELSDDPQKNDPQIEDSQKETLQKKTSTGPGPGQSAPGNTASGPSLQQKTVESPGPGPGHPPDTVYQKVTQLMIRHHAHPILVHTPNGLLPVAAVLFILAWVFDASLPAKAAAINLVFVVLALPLVLYTGVLEWQKKYRQADTLIFRVKILAATMTTAASVISLVWYLLNPAVLSTSLAWVFILVNLIMLVSAGIAGHIGGKLVFKD
jgi:uncharacterized membrane protein